MQVKVYTLALLIKVKNTQVEAEEESVHLKLGSSDGFFSLPISVDNGSLV